MSPVLPLGIECDVDDVKLGECQTTEIDASQCPHVAGVNCRG